MSCCCIILLYCSWTCFPSLGPNRHLFAFIFCDFSLDCRNKNVSYRKKVIVVKRNYDCFRRKKLLIWIQKVFFCGGVWALWVERGKDEPVSSRPCASFKILAADWLKIFAHQIAYASRFQRATRLLVDAFSHDVIASGSSMNWGSQSEPCVLAWHGLTHHQKLTKTFPEFKGRSEPPLWANWTKFSGR